MSLSNYYVLLYTEEEQEEQEFCLWRTGLDWFVIGIFLKKPEAQKYMKNESQYQLFEIKGSQTLDEEALKYFKGEMGVFCLVRYEEGHCDNMDVLCVSEDFEDIENTCQQDFPIESCFTFAYYYYYNRFILNEINYETESIPLYKEKEDLKDKILESKIQNKKMIKR